MDYAPKMDRFGREITNNKLTDDEGFLLLSRDFETLTGRQNLWVSVSVLRQIAGRNPEVGLVPAERLEDAEAEIGRWQARAEQAEAERHELRTTVESYKAGFEQVVGRKPPARKGRPPAKVGA